MQQVTLEPLEEGKKYIVAKRIQEPSKYRTPEGRITEHERDWGPVEGGTPARNGIAYGWRTTTLVEAGEYRTVLFEVQIPVASGVNETLNGVFAQATRNTSKVSRGCGLIVKCLGEASEGMQLSDEDIQFDSVLEVTATGHIEEK